mmetsp:Transcript_32425/g.87925  ORF Transcript_32425/g.87925 Transcript_32425/m.87925 type:complete len:1222 (-) Transcript_32425:273-3938(-)
MVGSPTKRATTMMPARGVVLGGGDSAAAGPMTRRTSQSSQVSAQLRAISLEYSHAELTTATLGWNSSRKLGAGCYGAVYRGELKDGSEVAIKAIDLGVLMGKGESPEDAGFDEEVTMLSKFRHPNLVTLLGWGQNGLSRYLVYEFLAGGDVFQRLHKSRVRNTDKLFLWHERLSVVLDAATGLSHMHNSTPKAFHRDIKSANILLDRHGTAKMADFGLSCTSGQSGALHITVKTISGTPGYKCPIYERTGRFTEGSEVYSFGMVLLEVLTGLDPSSADPHLPGGILYPVAETIAPSSPGAIDRCARNLDASASWPAQLAHEFGVMALRGVATHDERSRPHFVEIVKSLRNMSERYPPTFTPSQSPPQPAPAEAVNKAKASYARAKTFPAAKEAAPGAPAAPAAPAAAPRAGVSVIVKAAPTSPVAASDHAEESPFALEVVMATGLDVEALTPEFRRMPLNAVVGAGDSPGAMLAAPVGRHYQQEFFEAWLPEMAHRTCISRKAFEICWTPGSDIICLVACGTNPMSVDGKVATKNSRMLLKYGSEVCFTYELKVLLRLRFVTAVVSPAHKQASFGVSAAVTPAGASVGAAAAGVTGASAVVAAAPGGGSYVSKAADAQLLKHEVKAAVAAPSPPLQWSVDQTYQLAGDGLDEHLLGRAVVLEGVASVGDAVEKLNQGSIQISSGYCIVYSATKSAYFLLYQPGFREVAFASLSVTEDASPGSQDQGVAHREVRLAAPARKDTHHLPDAAVHPVVRMESSPHEVKSESTSAGSGAPSSGGASCSVTAVAWRLLCIHADGVEDLASLPADLREFPLDDGTTQVGRHHQPQHFEAWLPDPILRFCVSRTHLDIATASCGNSSLVITNRSGNLLCIDREPVPKGEPRALGMGQTISFARQEGKTLVHFLILQVRSAEPLVVEDNARQLPRPLVAHRETVKIVCANMDMTTVQAAQAGAKASPQGASRDIPSFVGSSRHTASVSSRSRSPDRPGRSPSGSTPAMAASVPPALDRRPRGSIGFQMGSPDEAPQQTAKPGVQVVLELTGEGVLDVPASRRTIGPVSLGEKPLLVGRRHQPELHQCAVSEDCLEYLSRDHFCVAYEGKEFWLLALTANRMWRDRDGEEPVQLARDDLVTLQPGDRILLGTGGDASSVEPARRRLCWHFRKADDAPAAGPRAGGGASPRRVTMAEGPPRWLSASALRGNSMAGTLDMTAKEPAPELSPSA